MTGVAVFRMFAVLALLGTVVPATSFAADSGLCAPVLHYAFSPDCFRPSLAATCPKPKTGICGVDHKWVCEAGRCLDDQKQNTGRTCGKDDDCLGWIDLPPQIAVWLESADGSQFIDTLMVTNLTAVRGLGNRPGHWSLTSSPKFPYGKRVMALPVWAHARGKLYDTVVMQDGDEKEFWLGFHERISSPDPYYCRPMTCDEIDVDAITCPTKVFGSAKGKFSATAPRSYYPPRNDLTNFTDRDCDVTPPKANCTMSAKTFADINDLDAVAAATPLFGSTYRGVWQIPSGLVDGDYAIVMEVGKEFDTNDSHNHEAHVDPQLSDSGLRNNIGQPSVVYRVPIRIDRAASRYAATTAIAGYGDWDGQTGTLHPDDVTISDAPGSGKGRLLAFPEPTPGGDVVGRVHVAVKGVRDCDLSNPNTGVIMDLAVPPENMAPTEADVRFTEADDGGNPVQQYEIRVYEGIDKSEASFNAGTPAPAVTPVAPGSSRTVHVGGLKSSIDYVVGIRARGCCIGQGPIAFASFRTPEMKFRQLSGCFVATAAHGTALASDVVAMKSVRDKLREHSALAAAFFDLYERSSPPVAAMLRQTDTGRALVRQLLNPAGACARAAENLSGFH